MKLRLSGAAFALAACTFIPLPALAAAITPSTIVALTNADRRQNGVGTLKEDARLNVIAQKAADDMLSRGYFAHTTPEGKSPWSWLITGGYYYYTAGQNIAMGFSSAQALEQAWMKSPAHRANIVKAAYTREGIGVASGTYLGEPTTFVVEFFATPPTLAAVRVI